MLNKGEEGGEALPGGKFAVGEGEEEKRDSDGDFPLFFWQMDGWIRAGRSD